MIKKMDKTQLFYLLPPLIKLGIINTLNKKRFNIYTRSLAIVLFLHSAFLNTEYHAIP